MKSITVELYNRQFSQDSDLRLIVHTFFRRYSSPKSVAGSNRPQSFVQQQTNSGSNFGPLYLFKKKIWWCDWFLTIFYERSWQIRSLC
jgi:hypothetical protein